MFCGIFDIRMGIWMSIYNMVCDEIIIDVGIDVIELIRLLRDRDEISISERW